MKKALAAVLAAVLLVPAIAFAADDKVISRLSVIPPACTPKSEVFVFIDSCPSRTLTWWSRRKSNLYSAVLVTVQR